MKLFTPPKKFIVKPGDIITFRGCCWSDGWEFDAPLIIYEPVGRYHFTGSICPSAIADKIEDLCIDLCEDASISMDFDASDLKEFKWRGWAVKGFAARKAVCRAEVTMKFYQEDDELAFDMIAAASVDRQGKLTPIFDGVPTTTGEGGTP